MLERALRVLVADDHPLVMMGVADLLEEAGFIAEGAPNGAAAIARLKSGPTVDILITDINMGAGPDGWEVAEAARAIDPLIPVIYMTGAAAHEFESRAVPTALLLTKPAGRYELVAMLDYLLFDQDAAVRRNLAPATIAA
jgi:CheY-like chemotaxis protein